MSDLVWIPDRSWRLVLGPQQCRQRLGQPPRRCPRAAVAELNRGRYWRKKGRTVASWWAYCESHLYGRRIVDDTVMVEVPKTSPAAERGYV